MDSGSMVEIQLIILVDGYFIFLLTRWSIECSHTSQPPEALFLTVSALGNLIPVPPVVASHKCLKAA